MLSIFPIQFLAPVAYALLRLCVGLVFFRFARTHLQHRASFRETFSRIPFFPWGSFFVWWAIGLELVVGASLVLGLFTQIGALIAVIYAVKFLVFFSRLKHPLGPTRQELILILCIALSLFITGPGIFAFDLPI